MPLSIKVAEGCHNESGSGSHPNATVHRSSSPLILRFRSSRSLIFFVIIFSILLFFYLLTFTLPPLSSSHNPTTIPPSFTHIISTSNSSMPPPPTTSATALRHIVFGIASSNHSWHRRKDYVKIWWRPLHMRGFVWLDHPPIQQQPSSLPPIKISSSTSNLPYTHPHASRSALRISRIVSETLRLSLPNIRWLVMCDDDTIFIPDNLVLVLRKFDHRQPYYIGSPSESHLQNILFSCSMAYGGGGFAISLPLAISLARMQDRCISRYPALYGSDDRIHACMSELGVPLTRHPGFHQFDVYGDLLGLLAAHPVAPLVSFHHLDVVDAIFPDSPSRAEAVGRLFEGPVRLDSAGVMQQSICYDVGRHWTVSVSWGFVVQVVRGVMSPREMERPARTFLNWYRGADYTAYAFNTRPVARNPCQRPFWYYLSSSSSSSSFGNFSSVTVTGYSRHEEGRPPECRWRLADPSELVEEVVVFKRPDPFLWDRAPRRNCCRVIPSLKGQNKNTMTVEVGVCQDG